MPTAFSDTMLPPISPSATFNHFGLGSILLLRVRRADLTNKWISVKFKTPPLSLFQTVVSVCETYFGVFLKTLIISGSELVETSSELNSTSSELNSTSSELISTGSELIRTRSELIWTIAEQILAMAHRVAQTAVCRRKNNRIILM